MSSRDILIDLELNKSLEEVWNLWTDKKKLEQWLTVKANVTPKLEGPYELFWQPETPEQNSTIDCKITTFVPNKILSFEWRGPVPFADLMNVNPLPTWASVSLESISPEKTIVHFRHSGWGNSTRWNEARDWQKNAWSMAFNELQAL